MTDARILGTGYRSYTGPRLGPRHAVWTLSSHSFERIMGLRRPARYKVLPILTFVIAYVPAVAFIGAIALLPTRRLGQFVPDPGVYDTVRDALAASGASVRRLQARTASLEEVYLEAADHGRVGS